MIRIFTSLLLISLLITASQPPKAIEPQFLEYIDPSYEVPDSVGLDTLYSACHYEEETECRVDNVVEYKDGIHNRFLSDSLHDYHHQNLFEIELFTLEDVKNSRGREFISKFDAAGTEILFHYKNGVLLLQAAQIPLIEANEGLTRMDLSNENKEFILNHLVFYEVWTTQ